tara:strand:+ start:400 stop:1551 length:1152 start_codon:yes stop_codon:yes gene_type:complete
MAYTPFKFPQRTATNQTFPMTPGYFGQLNMPVPTGPATGYNPRGMLPLATPNAMPRNQKAAIIMGALSDIFRGQDPTQNTIARQQQMVDMDAQRKAQERYDAAFAAANPQMQAIMGRYSPEQWTQIQGQVDIAALQPTKQPTSIQEFEYAKSQMPGLTLEDFYSMKKSSTNINMNQNSNRLWDFSLDNLKKDMDAISEQKQLIDKVRPAQELLLSGDVETGYFQEKILPAKQIFNSLGITADENLGEKEFVLATTKFLVPRMREKGSGSTSDFEAQLFEQAAPSFGKSTEGNLILMGTWLQTAERDAELVALKEDYILANSGNVFGFDKYLDQLAQEGKEPKIYERFGNPNDVVTAFENKQIKDGEIIIMNGELIVFRKDDII